MKLLLMMLTATLAALALTSQNAGAAEVQFTSAIRIKDHVTAYDRLARSYLIRFDNIYLYSADGATTGRVSCEVDEKAKTASLLLQVTPVPLFDADNEFLKIYRTEFKTVQDCRRAFFAYFKTSAQNPVKVTFP